MCLESIHENEEASNGIKITLLCFTIRLRHGTDENMIIPTDLDTPAIRVEYMKSDENNSPSTPARQKIVPIMSHPSTHATIPTSACVRALGPI